MNTPFDDACLDAAAAIGATLVRNAIWDGDRCNWVGAASWPGTAVPREAHRAFGPDFYEGTAGIAWFLLALHDCTRAPLAREVAEGALRQSISRMDALDGAPLSVFSGRLGLVRVLLRAADVLHDDTWEAHAWTLLDPLLLHAPAPHEIDVVSGAAGAIPALLDFALRDAARASGREGALLACAQKLGDFLVASAEHGAEGWSWRTAAGRKNLTGYAHGTSGIACALLQLFARIPHAKYRAAAMQALAYERTHFDREQANWPDFREFSADNRPPTPRTTCGLAWCHGAPGIALARLRAFELTGDRSTLEEARAGLSTTCSAIRHQVAQGGGSFSLCHGLAGNAEIVAAGRALLPDGAARRTLESVLELGLRKHADNGYWPSGLLSQSPTYSLMVGMAGTGHFLLRSASPDRVPSALIVVPGDPCWDPSRDAAEPSAPARHTKRAPAMEHARR